MNRRLFMRAVAAAGVFANAWTVAKADDNLLPRTPGDYEGPYYPTGPRNATNDLIVGEARERVLSVSGQIVDTHGAPLENALFDFWQADPLGHYNHPRDRSRGERWSDFLYWGEARTDADGRFELRTYVPGEYGSRPPHIHYKVWSNDKALLTSQMYFAELGGPRGAARSSSAAERQTVSLKEQDDMSVSAVLKVVV
jgi:protocatechuate 3,4-dioxygenase, beta subunit